MTDRLIRGIRQNCSTERAGGDDDQGIRRQHRSLAGASGVHHIITPLPSREPFGKKAVISQPEPGILEGLRRLTIEGQFHIADKAIQIKDARGQDHRHRPRRLVLDIHADCGKYRAVGHNYKSACQKIDCGLAR